MAHHEHAPRNANAPVRESLPTRHDQQVSRRRWIWLVGACFSLLLTAGCQQFVILGYLIGGPPSIEPDFDKETGLSLKGKENTVAVVCFAPKEMLLEFPNIDDEIAAQVASSSRREQNHHREA